MISPIASIASDTVDEHPVRQAPRNIVERRTVYCQHGQDSRRIDAELEGMHPKEGDSGGRLDSRRAHVAGSTANNATNNQPANNVYFTNHSVLRQMALSSMFTLNYRAYLSCHENRNHSYDIQSISWYFLRLLVVFHFGEV